MVVYLVKEMHPTQSKHQKRRQCRRCIGEVLISRFTPYFSFLPFLAVYSVLPLLNISLMDCFGAFYLAVLSFSLASFYLVSLPFSSAADISIVGSTVVSFQSCRKNRFIDCLPCKNIIRRLEEAMQGVDCRHKLNS